MIDRLCLLEVVASIFVSITIMDLSLNMNDNLELFIRKYNIVGLKLFGLCLCNGFVSTGAIQLSIYVLKTTNVVKQTLKVSGSYIYIYI